MFIIITFDSVCDRLGSPSDLVKYWGGSVMVACGVLRRECTYGSQYHVMHVTYGARSYQ